MREGVTQFAIEKSFNDVIDIISGLKSLRN